MSTPQAVRSFEALMNLAAQGRPYYHSQVYYPLAPAGDPRTRQLVGYGFDFERTMPVQDVNPAKTVPASVSMRIIRLHDKSQPSLFLRTRLAWTTSLRKQHCSFACYDITPEAAAELAASTPPDASAEAAVLATMTDEEQQLATALEEEGVDLAEALDTFMRQRHETVRKAFVSFTDDIDQAAKYKAKWRQTFPGSDFAMSDSPEDETSDRDFLQVVTYHANTVMHAQEREPQLLCMLSDSDFGTVHPGELDKLLEWLTGQPELATANS